mgnify:FL=1
MMLSLIGLFISLYAMMGIIAVSMIALVLLPYFIEQWIVDLKKFVRRLTNRQKGKK